MALDPENAIAARRRATEVGIALVTTMALDGDQQVGYRVLADSDLTELQMVGLIQGMDLPQTLQDAALHWIDR